GRLRSALHEPHAAVRPGEGEGAARHVRLRGPRRRRLSRESRRLAAFLRPRLAAHAARAAEERAVEEVDGRDRHPRHLRQGGEAAGPARAGTLRQGAVVRLRLDRRLSRRRGLPAAPLGGLHRAGELRDVRPSRIQRALRESEDHPARPRARCALHEDGEAHHGVHAVDGGDVQGAERAHAALAARLQETPVHDRALEIPGRRPRAQGGGTAVTSRMATAPAPVKDGPAANLIVAALVLVLAWQLAYWTWELAAPASAARISSRSAAEVDPAAIARLFGADAPASSGNSVDGLVLKGVVAPTPGTAASAIFAPRAGKDVSIFIGEDVRPGVKLVEVDPGYVLVSRGGVRERIDLADWHSRTSPRGSSPSRGFHIDVARTGANQYSLSRVQLDQALRDPSQLQYLGQIA